MTGAAVVLDVETEQTRKRNHLWTAALSLVLVASVATGCQQPSPDAGGAPAAEPEQARAAVGSPAPFNFTLKNLEGADVPLESFKGKVVLINFWATWCGPCRAEIPDLAELQREHAEDLAVVGIVVLDSFGDKVRAMATELGVNYPILDGNGNTELEDAYGPMWGLPTSVIIGRDGRVAKRQTGAASKKQFASMLAPLL